MYRERDWHLIFPGCEGKEMRNHAMKKRANDKVKTQNDSRLHATVRNDRGGPKDSIFLLFLLFFFWRRGRRRISGVHRYSKFPSLRYPPVHGGVWRICLFIL